MRFCFPTKQNTPPSLLFFFVTSVNIISKLAILLKFPMTITFVSPFQNARNHSIAKSTLLRGKGSAPVPPKRVMRFYRLSHNVVTSDMDYILTTAYCQSFSGYEVDWFRVTLCSTTAICLNSHQNPACIKLK